MILLSTEQSVHRKIISASRVTLQPLPPLSTLNTSILMLANVAIFSCLEGRVALFPHPSLCSMAYHSSELTATSTQLGVQITSDLLWSSHILNICNKTRMIGMMYRRFYKYSSSNTLLKLYTSFIRPHLEYMRLFPGTHT